MGQFLNQIRKKLGLEPKRDKTLTGKIPNEVVVNRAAQNEAYSPDRPVVLAPARMNPPTAGHGVLVRQVMDTAKQLNAPHHIILTRSHDTPTKKKVGAAVKNPLNPEQKLTHARRFFPGANIDVAHPDRPNLLSQASELHRQGHNHLVVVAGSDRVPEYERLLNQYNGQEGKHGYYNFKKISVVPAGAERDPKAGGLAGWSGTAARKAVESGDTEQMRKVGVPSHVSDEHFNQYVQHLKAGMGLNQPVEEEAGYPVPAIPTRTARDFLGKKSPLNNLPAPGKKGNIGLDADLDDDQEKTNFQLMRRRSMKRQQHAGFLEGYDDFDVGATDSPKPDASTPTTTPVPSRPVKKKIQKEGMFAADVANGETGESGNPNQSMEGIPTTAKETKVKKFKSIREDLRDPKDNPCWKGYEPVGTKKKNGKTVPNCVPKEETELEETKGSGARLFNTFRNDAMAVNKQRFAKQRYKKTGVVPGSKTPTADAVAKFLDKGGQVKKYNSRGEPMNEAIVKSNKDGSSGSRGTTFSSGSPNSYKIVNSKGEHLGDALNMKDPKYGGRTTHWHVTWHKDRHKDHPTSFQYMHQLKKHVKELDEATYKGKTVPLNKPMAGDVKKSKVYVDPDGDGKAQKVNFGDKNLSIKKNIPARKKSYCARSSGQGNLTDKTSANYWSRRAWNCEEIDYDDDDNETVNGVLKRGTRVKIKKDGYKGKGNIDLYDPISNKYLVSIDKNGSNLHLDADEIEPMDESLHNRVKAILEGKK